MLPGILFVVLASYLLGAIPFSFIIGKLWGADVRATGSGNVGARNVLRTCGKVPGALALAADVGKGAGAVVFTQSVSGLASPNWLILAGILAVVGHGFPVFLKFKGGKCIATSCGVMLALAPAALLSTAVLFGMGLLFFKKVPVLGSVFVVVLFPVFMVVYYLFLPNVYALTYNVDIGWLLLGTLFLMVLIVYKHIPNFKKMKEAGKIGFRW